MPRFLLLLLIAGAVTAQSTGPSPENTAPACKQCAGFKAPGALSCFSKTHCQPQNACEQCAKLWCEWKMGHPLDCGTGDDTKSRQPAPGPTASGDWVPMFDGHSLDGWRASDHPESWTVRDGTLVGSGELSYLYWTKEECENCAFKARVRLGRGSNSGMFFRARPGSPHPNGYEAQLCNTTDTRRTGSLRGIVDISPQLVQDETWFTQEVIADGAHIVIKVNGTTVVDFTEPQRSYTKGLLILQVMKGSTVEFQDLMYRRLP